jgi:hypothetical protein
VAQGEDTSDYQRYRFLRNVLFLLQVIAANVPWKHSFGGAKRHLDYIFQQVRRPGHEGTASCRTGARAVDGGSCTAARS